jgi:hypothetical protein
MTHWVDNCTGRTTSQPSRWAKKTNNQASFGGSLLKNNMEVEAAMERQRQLDETGVDIVCHLCMRDIRFAPGLTKVCSMKTWFAHLNQFAQCKLTAF